MSAVISVSAGCLSVGEGKQRGPITQIENSLYVYFILRGVWLGGSLRSSPIGPSTQLSGSSSPAAAAHRFTRGSIAAGTTQFGGCRWCCCSSARSVETRDERGGGGGIRGPTTKHSAAPEMNSSDPKSRSHEQTVVDESFCALRGDMRAREFCSSEWCCVMIQGERRETLKGQFIQK